MTGGEDLVERGAENLTTCKRLRSRGQRFRKPSSEMNGKRGKRKGKGKKKTHLAIKRALALRSQVGCQNLAIPLAELYAVEAKASQLLSEGLQGVKAGKGVGMKVGKSSGEGSGGSL